MVLRHPHLIFISTWTRTLIHFHCKLVSFGVNGWFKILWLLDCTKVIIWLKDSDSFLQSSSFSILFVLRVAPLHLTCIQVLVDPLSCYDKMYEIAVVHSIWKVSEVSIGSMAASWASCTTSDYFHAALTAINSTAPSSWIKYCWWWRCSPLGIIYQNHWLRASTSSWFHCWAWPIVQAFLLFF